MAARKGGGGARGGSAGAAPARRDASRARGQAGPRTPARAAAKQLHLECFSGIAGNMLLGALLDAGLPRRELDAALEGVGLKGALRVRRVRRGALRAPYVSVVPPGARRRGGRTRAGDEGPAHPKAPGRRYREIHRLLGGARLSKTVRERARAIFEALARAEARVHGIAVERVHFHEVGAADAIADVVGAAAGLEALGVRSVTAGPIALGGGAVDTAHGRLPLPAPAALELLRGAPVVPAHVEWETVTPTGAAILRTVVDEFRPFPAMTVERVGYGAGDDREGPLPNVLRAVLGRSGAAGWDRVLALETNLDDLVPEHFDFVMERLFEAGALDVHLQHVQTKKNRPGFLLRALVPPPLRDAVAGVLFAETETLGVRAVDCDRLVLARERRRVETPYGRVAVKVVWAPGGRAEVSPEYDDCRRAARRARVPLREVVRAAEAAGRSALERAR